MRIIAPVMMMILMAIAGVCWGTAEPVTQNEWKVSDPEEQGMDSEKLSSMLRAIDRQQMDVQSVVIVRQGRLVLETYGESFDRNVKQDLHTCTKSVVSVLVGIAIKDGYISGVEQKVMDFFPGFNIDEGMKQVSLKHLLSDTSGMKWYERPVGPVISQLISSPDWVRFILEQPVNDPPGTVFNDNSGASHLLSAAIARATGRPVLKYADERLFGPLGITELEWGTDPQGIPIGGWGLKMRPVDMAKLGYLMLKNGTWNGKEIVPAAWVAESTRKQFETARYPLSEFGFGYQWWMNEFGGFSALSDQGKFIFVVPEKDLVVVFTGNLDNDFRMPRAMMKYFILPSIKSDKPLSSNPKAKAELRALIHNPSN